MAKNTKRKLDPRERGERCVRALENPGVQHAAPIRDTICRELVRAARDMSPAEVLLFVDFATPRLASVSAYEPKGSPVRAAVGNVIAELARQLAEAKAAQGQK